MVDDDSVVTPKEATQDDLLVVHTASYLDSLRVWFVIFFSLYIHHSIQVALRPLHLWYGLLGQSQTSWLYSVDGKLISIPCPLALYLPMEWIFSKTPLKCNLDVRLLPSHCGSDHGQKPISLFKSLCLFIEVNWQHHL